jgi:IS4 transposase
MTQGSFSSKAHKVSKVPLCEMPLLFGSLVDLSEVSSAVFRNRIFTLSRTFWLFLHQVLCGGCSCAETVAKAMSFLGIEEGEIASSNTSAYCQARSRLPAELIEKQQLQLAQTVAEQSDSWRWHGHVVKVVDGSSVSMPDTPENQEKYPQPGRQKEGCGFPVMRLVCLFSLASGALLRRERGSLNDHERTLWRRMWPNLDKGDVVLADRGFCSFGEFAMLGKQGVDMVTRLNAKRTVGVRLVEQLGRGDQLVEWEKTKSSCKPEWISIEDYEALPQWLRVRHVSFTVSIQGFRSQKITVATTLLDPKLYPAREFAALYRRRWMAELFLRDLKTSLGMDVLRCKSPAMVEKELEMHLIAYNLVRALMLSASVEYPCEPTELSFKLCLSTVRQWAPAMEEAESEGRHREMLHLLLYYLANTLVPHRPGRIEPRAKKRRAKNYQLLNKPRNLMKPVKHRNRYAKPLS